MTRIPILVLACLLYASPVLARGGGLDDFLHHLNVEAHADPEGFSATLSSQFRVSGTEVSVVLGAVNHPADAFMVLQLGQMCGQPTDAVMRVYESSGGKGWGAMAQQLGIKPGSAEFHALKRGDLHFGAPPASRGGDHRPGHAGRGRGH